MKKKKLTNELSIAEICFGGNVFGWTLDEKASLRMLDELHDQGINFIDTANSYSHWVEGNVGGESERIIGKWFKESKKRQDVVLATKVGGGMQGVERGLTRQQIIDGVDASLLRLRTDYIDLYYSHHDDVNVGVEEIMGTFQELIQAGKVRALGASNLSGERLLESNQVAEAKGWTKYIALQPLYNLYDRVQFETEYKDIVEKEKLAVAPYFALASGFLSGKYKTAADLEGSARKMMVEHYLNERGLAILDALAKTAQKHEATSAEIAIAWLLHQPVVTAPIVSATSAKQLQHLVRATQVKLDSDDLMRLDDSSRWES
ncbi:MULTISPECIES: aldo/keto reductase [unclassified Myroides]|uniref:aldo/keto reductase n=1 Tax=unclassified Myroides TaxID=2642485 RepID=UPI0015F95C5F|nr:MULTISPECIES: aldo/keto reductase [unclassified Myroides]MBB1149111.1 aldo/keto reductase [Myroides sp. NP-2]MDM1406130.1 aldo/keto reductase [Myroides sp. DF42-4-2]